VFFGNRTIGIHLIKGILGVAALYASLSTMRSHFWPGLILLAAAIYLLKGCPMCWTMGLIETIVMTIHRRNERKFDESNSKRHGQFRLTYNNSGHPNLQTTVPAQYS
jgi:hypothetical protein